MWNSPGGTLLTRGYANLTPSESVVIAIGKEVLSRQPWGSLKLTIDYSKDFSTATLASLQLVLEVTLELTLEVTLVWTYLGLCRFNSFGVGWDSSGEIDVSSSVNPDSYVERTMSVRAESRTSLFSLLDFARSDVGLDLPGVMQI